MLVPRPARLWTTRRSVASGRGGRFGHESVAGVANGQEVAGVGRIGFKRLAQPADELVGARVWTWPCMPQTFSSSSCRGMTRPSCSMKYCRSFISSWVMRIGRAVAGGLEGLEVDVRLAEFDSDRSARGSSVRGR